MGEKGHWRLLRLLYPLFVLYWQVAVRLLMIPEDATGFDSCIWLLSITV